ncbi:TRAP transporter substrate-binding protein DctP [Pseudonocardia sp. C8]|uniref:TRAP transporter substrate-binding protein n=1 Tax=Pseudonocardia sp. C8 TaxID=2762759 RepID=UPI0016436A6C|nr:TRAP transporter substrate-binding protein DctP [Pseudonocardia sp. C8]
MHISPPARGILIGLLLALCLVLTGCGAGQLRSADGTYHLSVADFFPNGHVISVNGARHFIARAEELSGGTVKFDYFPAAQMGDAENLVDLTRAGVVDVATAVPAYVPAKLPLSGVADLPGATTDACDGSLAFERLSAPGGILWEKDFTRNDIRPLFVAVLPGYEVMTRTRPALTPADVRGMTLRSSGGTVDRAISAAGAAPVSMSSTDTYLAVSRGTVDGLVFPPLSASPYRLGEVVDHITQGANLGAGSITYSVSERVWQQLPPEVQQALEQAGRETTRHLCQQVTRKNAEALAGMARDGARVHTLTPQQRAAWAREMDTVTATWRSEMESVGLAGDAVYAEMTRVMAEVREERR